MNKKEIYYAKEMPKDEFEDRLTKALSQPAINDLLRKYLLPPRPEFPYWEYIGPWPI